MVDLILADSDEKWDSIQDETIRKLVKMDEPAVFEAYQKMWNDAADVIAPMVREIQMRNGVEPYTPEQYAGYGNGWGKAHPTPEENGDRGSGTGEDSQVPEENADHGSGTGVQEP